MGLRVLNTGVSYSDLQQLLHAFGPDAEVVGFEVCGITRDRPEKRKQAAHNRDYLRSIAGNVLTGLVHVRHPEATPEELDFLLNVNHYHERRYQLATVMSIEFPRAGGGTVLSHGEQKLTEKILDLHGRTGIGLDSLFDSYRLGTWDEIAHFFPEYSRESFMEVVIGPRSLVQELYTGLTVAIHTPRQGVVITRQPYHFIHPTDGSVVSDVDVMLVTPPGEARRALSSMQREQGATLILSSALAACMAPQPSTHYEKAA